MPRDMRREAGLLVSRLPVGPLPLPSSSSVCLPVCPFLSLALPLTLFGAVFSVPLVLREVRREVCSATLIYSRPPVFGPAVSRLVPGFLLFLPFFLVVVV